MPGRALVKVVMKAPACEFPGRGCGPVGSVGATCLTDRQVRWRRWLAWTKDERGTCVEAFGPWARHHLVWGCMTVARLAYPGGFDQRLKTQVLAKGGGWWTT